jgi:hypothetical protein
MRYRLTVLMPFIVLPVMNVLAAPAPDPSAILDIGPPPKGMTAEEYCKDQIQSLRHRDGVLWDTRYALAVRKLPSVARLKDPHPWLAANLRVTSENGDRHVRLRFLAGTRSEQVTVLNELVRVRLRSQETAIKFQEECLRSHEACIIELERRIASGQHRKSVDSYREGIDELRSIRIPEVRAKIARMKQYSVVKWAR